MTEPTTPAPIHPTIASRLAELVLGTPHVHAGFGLWPVMAPAQPEPAYVTLIEALDQPGFRVTEVSEDGSVPNLRVINETSQHVLLFDGEELKGAKQNRILNTSILVAAGTSLDVPVSCTERGRWSYAAPDFTASGSMAHAELRKRKAASVAKALIAKKSYLSDQGEVWSEIEHLHCAAKTSESSPTRAMQDAFRERQRELDDFTRDLPYHDGQCGLLAVVGDRVEGVDLVSLPAAYARLHRRLAESHAMDFLFRRQLAKPKPLDLDAPARFLAEAAKAHESQHPSPGLGTDHRLRFRWGHGAALRVDETVVHLALFGGGGHSHTPSEPAIRRNRHGW